MLAGHHTHISAAPPPESSPKVSAVALYRELGPPHSPEKPLTVAGTQPEQPVMVTGPALGQSAGRGENQGSSCLPRSCKPDQGLELDAVQELKSNFQIDCHF